MEPPRKRPQLVVGQTDSRSQVGAVRNETTSTAGSRVSTVRGGTVSLDCTRKRGGGVSTRVARPEGGRPRFDIDRLREAYICGKRGRRSPFPPPLLLGCVRWTYARRR